MNEKICPICGKSFIPAVFHQWKEYPKTTGRLVCSYTCERKSEQYYQKEKKK